MFYNNHHIKEIDEASFKRLHQLYSGILYNYVFKLTGNTFISEEITQETFIKLWDKRKSLSDVNNHKAYLFTIAKNLLMDSFKKEKVVNEARLKVTPKDYHQHTPQLILEENELDKVKSEAINNLKGITKEVFIMSREKSLSYLEISKILGISKVAVKKQMMKALFSLRKYINPYLDVELIIFALTALAIFISI